VIFRLATLVSLLSIAMGQLVHAQNKILTFPGQIIAGAPFSVESTGAGKGILYIVGIGQVIKRDLQLGQTTYFEPGALYDAGHYLVIFAGDASSETDSLEVTPAKEPANLTFLAKPSRLSVGLQGGITGAVYVFDAFKNLVTVQTPVTFELSSPSSNAQTRTVMARNGAAWTKLDSTAHQGSDKFTASSGPVSNTRIIGQVPGDPCGLKMSASPSGKWVKLQTDPIRDCTGNPVPDGTIVTFTEAYDGDQSTVDVPIKRGIAEVQMPVHPGAVITVASGVVMGNQIRWESR
jgi:hypothetical protein